MRLISKFVWILPGVGFIAGLLVLMQALVTHGGVNRVLLPPPTAIAVTLGELISHGDFLPPLLSTLGLFALSFALSVIIGLGLGVLMGMSRVCRCLLEPLIELLRPMPKPALLPMLMLFLGIGLLMKTTVIVLTGLFPVLINTLQGVIGVDPVLTGTGRTFGLSRVALIRKVVLPAAMPYAMSGIRISLGLCLLVTVLAEMLTATSGLGFTILHAEREFRIGEMYAWLVVLAVLGFAMNYAIAQLEKRLTPWLHP